MNKHTTKKVLLFIAASNCAISTLEPALAQATNAPGTATFTPVLTPAPTTAPVQPGSLSWIHEKGIAYVLAAVQPPPAPGSDKEKADVQAVINAASTRTEDPIRQAVTEPKFVRGMLASVIDPNFTPKNYPVTFDFLDRMISDTNSLNAQVQAKYQRPRPYQDHPEVKRLFTVPSSSYPSGPAATSRMLTLVLSELFGTKGTDLLHRDDILAKEGVIAGVNYPSDIVAGRALATALMFVLQDNPDFDKDMAKARAEIAAHKQ